ncbi:hypothetical protein Q0Z83_054250 [Actinoplanes sichuanensis]|nr:hypothetical protein Q0Z83_054250 [Actinoplanes sichuanensis]
MVVGPAGLLGFVLASQFSATAGLIALAGLPAIAAGWWAGDRLSPASPTRPDSARSSSGASPPRRRSPWSGRWPRSGGPRERLAVAPFGGAIVMWWTAIV